jgi:hypothetical protein
VAYARKLPKKHEPLLCLTLFQKELILSDYRLPMVAVLGKEALWWNVVSR